MPDRTQKTGGDRDKRNSAAKKAAERREKLRKEQRKAQEQKKRHDALQAAAKKKTEQAAKAKSSEDRKITVKSILGSPRKMKSATRNPSRQRRMTVTYCPPGCNVPIWRLEMARRAGSGEQSFLNLYPGLTAESLREAFDYARRHFDTITRMIAKRTVRWIYRTSPSRTMSKTSCGSLTSC